MYIFDRIRSNEMRFIHLVPPVFPLYLAAFLKTGPGKSIENPKHQSQRRYPAKYNCVESLLSGQDQTGPHLPLPAKDAVIQYEFQFRVRTMPTSAPIPVPPLILCLISYRLPLQQPLLFPCHFRIPSHASIFYFPSISLHKQTRSKPTQ